MKETISRALAGIMPLTWISPCEHGDKPATNFSKVDLPQPEGPMMETNSPFSIERLISSNTGADADEKRFPTTRKWISGMVMTPPVDEGPICGRRRGGSCGLSVAS